MSDNKIHIDKPILPKEIGEAIEQIRLADWHLSEMLYYIEYDGEVPYEIQPIKKWVFEADDIEDINKRAVDFSIAWITEEYEIDEGPLFYAKIKGWELVRLELYYWNYSISDTEVFPNTKDESDLYHTKNTLEGWRRYGINSTNADFEEVVE